MTTTIAGRYTLLHRLGEGGMAQVWLARQHGYGNFEKLVVVKRMLDAIADDESYRAMFLDEAKTAAALRHPNVIAVLDVGVDDQGAGALFMVLEYLHGRDVAAIMRRAFEVAKPPPLALTLQIVADAAAGLAHAHAVTDLGGKPLRIVHRDVSPQNLVVTFDGPTKVVDFGVARRDGRATHTQAGTVRGKVAYMAPEMLLGESYDSAVDQFALGVVLWEMATGNRLFRRATDVDTIHAIVEGDVPRPRSVAPGVPQIVEDIVMTALAFRAADRFADCGALAAALWAAIDALRAPRGMREMAAYLHALFPDAAGPTTLAGQRAIAAQIVPGDALLDEATAVTLASVLATHDEMLPVVDDPLALSIAANARERFSRVDGADGEIALVELEAAAPQMQAALLRCLDGPGTYAFVDAGVSLCLALETLRRGRDATRDLSANIDRALDRARAVERTTKDVARLWEARGDIHKGRGDLNAALADYEFALAMSERLDDGRVDALVRRNIADVLCDLGRLDEAVAHAQLARAAASDAGDERLAARALLVLGRAGQRAGNYDVAVAALLEARARFHAAGDARFVGRALLELAKLRHAQGDVSAAAALCDEARRIHQETGERRYEGRALGNLGVLLAELGEAEAARRAYDEALSILREVGDRRSEAILLTHVGALSAAAGDRAAAERCWRNARDLLDEKTAASIRGALAERIAALG